MFAVFMEDKLDRCLGHAGNMCGPLGWVSNTLSSALYRPKSAEFITHLLGVGKETQGNRVMEPGYVSGGTLSLMCKRLCGASNPLAIRGNCPKV